MNPYLILAALLLACVTGAGVQGYRMGGAANEARHVAEVQKLQREINATAEWLSVTSAALEKYRAAQSQIASEAENAARADSAAADRRPSPDSLRRLTARWSGLYPAP